ncbi:hypothetical protein B0J18DRAFT_26625 [Chaetomium sp. MPI-SDFR-AT-0129]|nr:hypothetical protein B0J18DRAFT_26625 [Chaetomium sp. MPI-SDFR-AT-0129]
MAPKRRTRVSASPSPAPDHAAITRAAIPTKYSISYGSPMSHLPDRAVVSSSSVDKAAAEIFTKVRRDKTAAEARRNAKAQERAARSGSRATTVSPSPEPFKRATPPPATKRRTGSQLRPTIEVEGPDDIEMSDTQQTNGDVGSEREDQENARDLSATRPAPKKPAPRDVRKRVHDDDEAEALAEKERKERDARLKRERSEEARRARERKRSEDAARKKAEQERQAEEKLQQQREAEKRKADDEVAEQQRLVDQIAREEAARAAMPPPPQRSARHAHMDMSVTPNNVPSLQDSDAQRPGSARSFIEERNLFNEAHIKTPTPPPAMNARQAKASAPISPPESQEAPQRPDVSSPPSVLKKPPRRPGGLTPKAHIRKPSGLARELSPDLGTPGPGIDEAEKLPEVEVTLNDSHIAGSYAQRVRDRLLNLDPSDKSQVDKLQGPEMSEVYDRQHHGFDIKGFFHPVVLVKTVIAAFLLLHVMRFAHTLARPDLFDKPLLTVRWYGWDDLQNNVGQFFPSPLLHPLGVLTNQQYNDMKDYMQTRAAPTQKAVEDIQAILPRVVSVKKDWKGRVVIAEEFWTALRDKIEHDNAILTLDSKSRISTPHWKAIEQRLKDAGLLAEHLSADDVKRIVDKAAPESWERWLQKNKDKVADAINPGKGPSKGTGETVISKAEFMREVSDRFAKFNAQLDVEMRDLRKEIGSVIKKLDDKDSMSKTETTTLINKLVDKEITRRLASFGRSQGSVGIDYAFRNRVNLFSPGNNAQIDISLSSPTWDIATPRVGSKKWLKHMPRQPQFLHDKSQALRPWTEPGHCWCAGTLGAANRTYPAVLAVRLPQFVVPQHVLLEHIDPAATTDPLAMPRDIEIWAQFDDHARRERVLDWMAAQFPSTAIPPATTSGSWFGSLPISSRTTKNTIPGTDRLLADGWAKIGQFAYEHRARDEGIFVHALSRDLVDRLQAETDSVLIRAVSNYGARDHTCFYRVRLYGEVV